MKLFVGILSWFSLFLLCWLLMFGPEPNNNQSVNWSMAFFALAALSTAIADAGSKNDKTK